MSFLRRVFGRIQTRGKNNLVGVQKPALPPHIEQELRNVTARNTELRKRMEADDVRFAKEKEKLRKLKTMSDELNRRQRKI